MAKQPSKVLDDRLLGLLERYETEVSDAAEYVTEKLSGIVERLIDEFGAPTVDAALKNYRIAPVLPKDLHEAFGPVADDRWQDEW
jgi:hypothetical protein